MKSRTTRSTERVKLVLDPNEIKRLEHILAARFGYAVLAAYGNNKEVNNRIAAEFFGRLDN